MGGGGLRSKRKKGKHAPMISSFGNVAFHMNMNGKEEQAQIRGPENIWGSGLLALGTST